MADKNYKLLFDLSDGTTKEVTFTAPQGEPGTAGRRGTGLLPVTTAPSSYTIAVNGLTPAYRIALSTVKSQASTTDVYAGDTVRYSYYHYPVIYVDASYVYCGTRVSIRGANGAAGSDYVLTEADKAEIAGMVNTGGIPEYWQIALDNGVEAIRAALEAAGRNKSAFLWYHDSHWTSNSHMSPVLLRYLVDHTALHKVNYGGDIVNTEEASNRDDWDYIYDWRDKIKNLPNHHSVRGNHDDDIPGLQTTKAIYAYLMAPEETPDIVRGGDFFYYIDDVNERTRYLYLDTHMCTTLTNQGDSEATAFAVEALNGTPESWHIVPIAHIWFLYNDWNIPNVGQIPLYCQQLLDLFDAYNARGNGSLTVNGTSISYDFANGKGKVEFCIGGHTHVDMDFTSTGGIPVLLTEADRYESRGGYDATPGTTGEASVNGIIADYDAKIISVVRIGRGASRVVSLESDKPKFTNVIKTSIDSSGAIFNGGKGWAANARIGSGLLENYIGKGEYYTTGYIEIDPSKDVTIRMKNISFDSSVQNIYIGFAPFNASFTRTKLVNANSGIDFVQPYQLLIASNNYAPVLDGNNVIEFTLDKDIHLWSDIKYIAICANYIGDDSIITINEEITGGGYTNLLDSAGYVKNKRLSQSSGYSETDQSGVCLTGYIPIKTGDTVYLKNMVMTNTFNTGYDQHIYFFDSSKSGYAHRHAGDLDGDSGIITAVWEPYNDVKNLVQFTYNGGTLDGVTYTDGYIRINAVSITADSIITINQPIE